MLNSISDTILAKLRLMGKVKYTDYYSYLERLSSHEFNELYIDLSLKLERRTKYFTTVILAFLLSSLYGLVRLFNDWFKKMDYSKLNIPVYKQQMIFISFCVVIILIILAGTYFGFSSHLNTKRKLMIMEQFQRDQLTTVNRGDVS